MLRTYVSSLFTGTQMILAVDKDASDTGHSGTRLPALQGDYKAVYARVGAGGVELSGLETRGDCTVQIIHEVLHCHADVGPMADHQDVERHTGEAVIGEVDGWPVVLDRGGGGVCRCRRWGFWVAVLGHHVLEQAGEELAEPYADLDGGMDHIRERR